MFYLVLGSPILNCLAPTAPVTPKCQLLEPKCAGILPEDSSGKREFAALPQGKCSQQQWVSLALSLCRKRHRVEEVCVRLPSTGGASRFSGKGCCHFSPLPEPILPSPAQFCPLPSFPIALNRCIAGWCCWRANQPSARC